MAIQVLAEQPGRVNLSGFIHRQKLIPLHRFMREHFGNAKVDIHSERSFLDDNENHIEIEIRHSQEAHIEAAMRLFRMVWM